MPTGSTDYAEFFLASPPNITQLECVEIFHTNFSQVFRLNRNSLVPITVTQTAGFFTGDFEYIYCPMTVSPLSSSTDLDQTIKITFGDLGEILPAELDLVSAAGGFFRKPIMTYRTYRDDDLTQELFGPIILEIQSISFNQDGATLDCKPPVANRARSGEVYTVDRFPMLEGTLR